MESGIESASAGGAGIFKVTFTVNEHGMPTAADKTFAEIVAAYNAGSYIYGDIGGTYALLLRCSEADGTVVFTPIPNVSLEGISNIEVEIASDNTVTNSILNYPSN